MLSASVSVITYAMKRRPQHEVFIPETLRILPERAELVVVDYSDVEGVGKFCVDLKHDKLTCVQVKGCEWFHMDHARNLGGRASVGDLLVFADIDFLLSPALFVELLEIKPHEYLVQPSYLRSFGFCACWKAEYMAARGYDETVCGYGFDDTQFQQMLSLRGIGRRVMASEVAAIGVGENTRNLELSDIGRNAAANRRILREMRKLNPRQNNVGRNWGWGGSIICQSGLRKAVQGADENAASRAASPGAAGIRKDSAP